MIILNKEREYNGEIALKLISKHDALAQMNALDYLKKLGAISKRKSDYFVLSKSLFMSERYKIIDNSLDT
jgi:hypothetical protein